MRLLHVHVCRLLTSIIFTVMRQNSIYDMYMHMHIMVQAHVPDMCHPCTCMCRQCTSGTYVHDVSVVPLDVCGTNFTRCICHTCKYNLVGVLCTCKHRTCVSMCHTFYKYVPYTCTCTSMNMSYDSLKVEPGHVIIVCGAHRTRRITAKFTAHT